MDRRMDNPETLCPIGQRRSGTYKFSRVKIMHSPGSCQVAAASLWLWNHCLSFLTLIKLEFHPNKNIHLKIISKTNVYHGGLELLWYDLFIWFQGICKQIKHLLVWFPWRRMRMYITPHIIESTIWKNDKKRPPPHKHTLLLYNKEGIISVWWSETAVRLNHVSPREPMTCCAQSSDLISTPATPA
jgi:hypothetical protein